MSRVSFSIQAKQELARVMPDRDCCRRAELIGLLRSCGNLTVTGGEERRFCYVWESEIAAVARKIFKMLRAIEEVEPALSVELRRRPKRRRFFRVEAVDNEVLRRGLFSDASPSESGQAEGSSAEASSFDVLAAIQRPIDDRPCCRRAFLRGAFLGFGSVTNPNKEHHLEMGPCEAPMLRDLQECLQLLDITGHVMERRDAKWLYLKGSESIVTMLQATGANLAVLQYQDIRLMRDMRNRVNRMVNAETANLTKAVEAGMRQIEAIRFIRANDGWEQLPPAVRHIAQLRLDHPELSLRELGELLEPPWTKSRVQNAMNRIQKMAARLSGSGKGNGVLR